MNEYNVIMHRAIVCRHRFDGTGVRNERKVIRNGFLFRKAARGNVPVHFECCHRTKDDTVYAREYVTCTKALILSGPQLEKKNDIGVMYFLCMSIFSFYRQQPIYADGKSYYLIVLNCFYFFITHSICPLSIAVTER